MSPVGGRPAGQVRDVELCKAREVKEGSDDSDGFKRLGACFQRSQSMRRTLAARVVQVPQPLPFVTPV